MIPRSKRQFADFFWCPVGERIPLEISPKSFHRVQFRSVGWEEFYMDIRMAFQPTVDDNGTVRIEPVPNDKKRFLNLSCQGA